MTGIFFILVWVVMTLLTATILYILEANSHHGKRFGRYDWADGFIGFHVMAGLFWPIALPITLLCIVVKLIGRYLRQCRA